MADTIQQQLIAARKNQILDAAGAVFAERGFHPTTIRDIAKRAGVADGTIYNYFASKPDLLFGIFERMQAVVRQESPPLPAAGTDLRTVIRAFLHPAMMSLQADNFALFRIVVSEMLVNEDLRTRYYEQILAPTLAHAETILQEQGAQWGLQLADPHLTVRAISGMVLGLMVEHILGDPLLATRWDDLPDLLADLLVEGVGGRP